MQLPTEREKRAKEGIKATAMGIAINLVLATGKLVAGLLGHSYALVADAAESGADVFSSLAVILGLRFAGKEPDEDHPYGHGKAEPVAAVIVSLAMLATAVFIAVEAVQHILTPHQTPKAFTLAVLVGVVIIKELTFRFVDKAGKSIDSNAVKADAWHHRGDALTSVAAFVGISIALAGGPGYESADDWAALVSVLFIVFNAFSIFKRGFGELMDAAPSPEMEQTVRQLALQVNHVQGIDKCRVRKMGFDYYVDIHVLVNGNLTVTQGHDIAHQVKALLIKTQPTINDVLVHVEPS